MIARRFASRCLPIILCLSVLFSACGGGGGSNSSSNGNSSAPANVAGLWELEVVPENFGAILGPLYIQQNGAVISGSVTVTSGPGTTSPPCPGPIPFTGSVSGNALTLTLKFQVTGSTATFTGTMNGNSLAGTYTSPSGEFACLVSDSGTWSTSALSVTSLSINTVPELPSGPITINTTFAQFWAYANGFVGYDVTQAVTWTSSNPAVATITTGGSSGNGILTALAAGTTTVTATFTNAATGAVAASNTVTVNSSGAAP
jgi:Bacterial Ig-like domain (group 2)